MGFLGPLTVLVVGNHSAVYRDHGLERHIGRGALSHFQPGGQMVAWSPKIGGGTDHGSAPLDRVWTHDLARTRLGRGTADDLRKAGVRNDLDSAACRDRQDVAVDWRAVVRLLGARIDQS